MHKLVVNDRSNGEGLFISLSKSYTNNGFIDSYRKGILWEINDTRTNKNGTRT